MKKLLFFFMLYPFALCAQTDIQDALPSNGVQDSVAETSIILRNNSLIFQKVYSSILHKEELLKKLKVFLPAVKSFQLGNETNQTTDQLSGKLSTYFINYNKYGVNQTGIGGILGYPITADVIIQVKENRYRVTISNIILKSVGDTVKHDVPIEMYLTKIKQPLITKSNQGLKTIIYINNEFSSSFDLNSRDKINDNF
ncbi:hypothetical protein H7F33_03435 [Pedobacter sp. PAMC26386]|nr:hypothetical protein H7F33_03435 [Pedobacter sp. PAMC26386]